MNCIAAGRRTIERRQGMSEYILEMRGITGGEKFTASSEKTEPENQH